MKPVRRRDASSPPLEAFAKYASARGWKFTIVLVHDAEAFDEVEVLDRAHVLQLLDDAAKVDRGSWIATIATAAAFEAAARDALVRDDAAARPSPLAHIQALAFRGLVSPDEEDVLRALLKTRNAAAHGMTSTFVAPELVTKTLEIARALVTMETVAA